MANLVESPFTCRRDVSVSPITCVASGQDSIILLTLLQGRSLALRRTASICRVLVDVDCSSFKWSSDCCAFSRLAALEVLGCIRRTAGFLRQFNLDCRNNRTAHYFKSMVQLSYTSRQPAFSTADRQNGHLHGAWNAFLGGSPWCCGDHRRFGGGNDLLATRQPVAACARRCDSSEWPRQLLLDSLMT